MYLRLLDSQAELALAREGSTGAHDNPHEARTRHCGLSAALVRWRSLGSSGASRGCTGVRTTLNARASWGPGERLRLRQKSGTAAAVTAPATRPAPQEAGAALPAPRLPGAHAQSARQASPPRASPGASRQGAPRSTHPFPNQDRAAQTASPFGRETASTQATSPFGRGSAGPSPLRLAQPLPATLPPWLHRREPRRP